LDDDDFPTGRKQKTSYRKPPLLARRSEPYVAKEATMHERFVVVAAVSAARL